MSSSKILVTGGAGFVGSHIVQELQKRRPEYSITILDLLPPPPTQVQTIPEVDFVQADVTDAGQTRDAIERVRPDLIVHAAGVVPSGAARYGRRSKDAVFRINVNGTRNVLDAARSCGVRALVYTSSCTIITDDNDRDFPNMDESIPIPSSALIYGQSKVLPSSCESRCSSC